MKKLLFVLLLSISSVVYAEWTLLDKYNDDADTVYIEKSTVQQFGLYTRAWFRWEHSEKSIMALKFKVRSARVYEEFDCQEKRKRRLSTTFYKQPNFIELDLSNEKVLEWQSIAPDTASFLQLAIVCNLSLQKKEFRNSKEKLIDS